MTAKKSETIQVIIILVLAAVIAGLLYYMIPYRYRLNSAVNFDPDLTVTNNPLMGFAPSGNDTKNTENASLVFIEVLWSEWEPSEGVFDIDALESKYRIADHKAADRNAVLRFIMDKPGEKDHMDIPDWLYQETGDGFFYTNKYGSGYSPNYANPILMEAHKAAIKALAEYCNQDSFVAFVELGSLGHWGEWHVEDESGFPAMPDTDICWEYVDHYTESFNDVKFLMRRSYLIAQAEGFGIYDDVMGEAAETDEWIKWTREGGIEETQGEDLAIVPYENFWLSGPVGGEYSSHLDWDNMAKSQLQDIFRQMDESHLTFLGPNIGPTDQEIRRQLMNHMGYRILVSGLTTKFSFVDNSLKVYMTWENKGSAPFAFDWDVMMNVYDKDNNLLYWEMVPIALSQLGPDMTIETENSIPYMDELRNGYSIGIIITDESGARHLKLAFEKQEDPLGDVEILYKFDPNE